MSQEVVVWRGEGITHDSREKKGIDDEEEELTDTFVCSLSSSDTM